MLQYLPLFNEEVLGFEGADWSAGGLENGHSNPSKGKCAKLQIQLVEGSRTCHHQPQTLAKSRGLVMETSGLNELVGFIVG